MNQCEWVKERAMYYIVTNSFILSKETYGHYSHDYILIIAILIGQISSISRVHIFYNIVGLCISPCISPRTPYQTIGPIDGSSGAYTGQYMAYCVINLNHLHKIGPEVHLTMYTCTMYLKDIS